MMSNDKLTPVEWLIEQFYNNEGMLTTKQLERAKQVELERMQEQYQDGRESVIIEHLAVLSTSNASSYSDGYKEGYNRAIELTKWTITNLIPPHNEQR
jgi:cell division inhibitor SulA